MCVHGHIDDSILLALYIKIQVKISYIRYLSIIISSCNSTLSHIHLLELLINIIQRSKIIHNTIVNPKIQCTNSIFILSVCMANYVLKYHNLILNFYNNNSVARTHFVLHYFIYVDEIMGFTNINSMFLNNIILILFVL